MRILLADRQDITRAGMIYVLQGMEGLEWKYTDDKAELMLALKENDDTVVVLDYTSFDINDADELLILQQRFTHTRWLLFSEDLSAEMEVLLAPKHEVEEKVNLTKTETEILKDIALGMTTKEIADKRFSSFHTVNTHRKNIFRKLNVNNVHEATKYALRAGLVDTAEYYI